ncbi:MAG: glycosyltransferase family 4 protein [Syntrophobacterales bacterium]|nr:glycosyltransferase family 4 protein [Syntrophobacterales bacterium]
MHPSGDKIKVIHIITRFDKGGSAENTFLTVCGLDKERYQVALVTGTLSGTNSNDPENIAIAANIAELKANGVRLIFVPSLVRELNPVADLRAFLSLCKIIRREKPDIVHTHTSKAGMLGRWAARLCRVPAVIHTPHGHVFWGYFNPAKTRLFIMLERWTARITDALIMLTPQELQDHLGWGIAPREKFTVIHSGVNLKKFSSAQSRSDRKRAISEVPENMVVIGTVGRLTAIKGQDVLIRAFAELKQAGEDVFLVLLGEGERRGELEEMARHLQISDSVMFLGWRPEVAAVMASFDIFCLPSLNEGMGKVIVEAMAMGLPVVASNVGGIKDLVRKGENGLLVPPGDATALAKALSLLCSAPQERRRMGDAGRLLAPSYSSEAMIKKVDRLYEGGNCSSY